MALGCARGKQIERTRHIRFRNAITEGECLFMKTVRNVRNSKLEIAIKVVEETW